MTEPIQQTLRRIDEKPENKPDKFVPILFLMLGSQ
jgi:hypothetical protein